MVNPKKYSNIGEHIRTGLMALGTGIGGFTAYQVYQANKEKKRKELRERYLMSRINPRTMRIEISPELLSNKKNQLVSFAAPLLIGAGTIALESAAFVGLDRVINYYTSPEYKAKKKIKEKYSKIYDKWEKNREKDYNKGIITGNDFDIEKEKMKAKCKISVEKEYKYWKEREDFIKEVAREHFDNLQKEVPTIDEQKPISSNFALFKDVIPQSPNNSKVQTNNVNIAPNLFDFIKLDVARGAVGVGGSMLKTMVLKEDKILTAVKKLLLTEYEIDSMKNVSAEKKDLLKFEAFKTVLAQFNNPADVDKVFSLKAKFENKMNGSNKNLKKDNRTKGKAINFEGILDSADFNGWNPEKEI